MLAALCVFAPLCKAEAMVSGKPVSFWVAKLEDRDKREWSKAFDALRFCTKEDLSGKARTRFRQMAVGGNVFSRSAALLLFSKFQEVDPKFTDAYLVINGDETLVYGREAIKALAGTSMENSDIALAALQKKLSRVDGNEKWWDDLSKLIQEVVAISKANR